MNKTENKINTLLNEGTGGLGCLMVNFTLPESVDLIKWTEDNVPESCVVKYEHEKHITILYGIKDHVPISTIQKFVESLPMIVVKLRSVSMFHQPTQDVLKITVESPQLQEINTSLVEYLGPGNVEPNQYKYNPHVTLAYITPNSLPHLDGNDSFNGYVYLMKEVVYSEPNSTRKHYFNLSNN